ncbi:MAG: hypothetical protein WBQ17_17210 [Rhizomicrobium sp.]
MPKVFIHVGAHKTATSFLQANLVANAAALERQGWRVIDLQKQFKKVRRQVVNVHHERQLGTNGKQRLDSFFEEVRNDPRDILITYEGFLGGMSLAKGKIYPHHSVPIKMLKESFPGRDIQIGFCIRNFADQAESSYNWRIAKGKTEKRFAKYAKKISVEKLSWLKIIECLSNTFGAENLVLWTFEEFKKDGVAAFAKIIQAVGIDASDIVAAITTPKNVSPTVEQAHLLRAWHKALHSHLKISAKDAKALKAELRGLLGQLPRDAKAGGHLKPKKRKALTEHYEHEVAAIRERWADRMLDFSPGPSETRSSPR